MTIKHTNTMKLAIVSLIFSTNFLTLANSTTQKVTATQSINWSNATKATILSTMSLASIALYYNTIIKPFIIKLIQEKGLAYTIECNKNFVMNNPKRAAVYATPLFLGIFYAILARDYAQNLWNKVEDTKEENAIYE